MRGPRQLHLIVVRHVRLTLDRSAAERSLSSLHDEAGQFLRLGDPDKSNALSIRHHLYVACPKPFAEARVGVLDAYDVCKGDHLHPATEPPGLANDVRRRDDVSAMKDLNCTDA
jgi:hypothetical protein